MAWRHAIVALRHERLTKGIAMKDTITPELIAEMEGNIQKIFAIYQDLIPLKQRLAEQFKLLADEKISGKGKAAVEIPLESPIFNFTQDRLPPQPAPGRKQFGWRVLNKRTRTALLQLGIKNPDQFGKLSISEALSMKNIGHSTVNELRKLALKYNVQLRD